MKNMKKVILAMTLLLAIPVARAQHCNNADVDMTAVYNKLSPNTITLPWKDSLVVCIHRDTAGHRVSVVNQWNFLRAAYSPTPWTVPAPTFTASYIDIPWQITVEDAKIKGDFLYFCGRYADTSQQGGVIGLLSLRNHGTLASQRVYYSVTPLIDIFNKFVVYRTHLGQTGAVVVGRKFTSPTINKILFYPRVDSRISMTPGTYILTTLPGSETIDDIMLVGNNIVTVGHDNMDLCIRKCSTGSIPLPNSSLQTKHAYTHIANEPCGHVYGTAIDDTTIVYAYKHQDVQGQNWVRLGWIDLNTMENTDSRMMTLPSKEEPLVLTGLKQSRQFVLMQAYTDSTGTQVTDVHLLPRAYTPANSNHNHYCFTHQNRRYTSVAHVYGKQLTNGGYKDVFLLNEGTRWYWQSDYRTHTGNITTFYCVYPKRRQTSPATNLPKNTNSSNFYPQTSIYSFLGQNTMWSTATPPVNCYVFQ